MIDEKRMFLQENTASKLPMVESAWAVLVYNSNIGNLRFKECFLMTTNAELTREYLGIIDELQGDIEGRRKAREYMKNSTAIVHHKVVDSTFIPKLFDKQS